MSHTTRATVDTQLSVSSNRPGDPAKINNTVNTVADNHSEDDGYNHSDEEEELVDEYEERREQFGACLPCEPRGQRNQSNGAPRLPCLSNTSSLGKSNCLPHTSPPGLVKPLPLDRSSGRMEEHEMRTFRGNDKATMV